MQTEMAFEFEFQTHRAWVRHVEELNREWTEEDALAAYGDHLSDCDREPKEDPW